MKLTKKEVEILIVIIGTELKMIQFIKGFNKDKSPYEVFLEKILEKLSAVVIPRITVKEGKYKNERKS